MSDAFSSCKFNCDSCENTGLVQLKPDSEIYHPCDSCRPGDHEIWMHGYNAWVKSHHHSNNIDKWFLYDGDDSDLLEFVSNIDWDCFTKAGRDRTGKNLVFLRVGDSPVAGIRSVTNKLHQKLIEKLKVL